MDDWNDLRSDWMNIAPAAPPDLRPRDARQTKSKHFHLGNLLVLVITLFAVGWFLFFFTQYGSSLARAGRWLMVGSLAVRICIEGYSTWRLSRIDPSDPTRTFVDRVTAFRRMRSTLHGPVTIGIVVVYSLGFYMLLPETYRGMGASWTLLFGASYAVGATIIILLVRRGIERERRSIEEWAGLADQLVGR
jgi:hypothetical protein